MARFRVPRRAEVWMTSLDPARGHEVRKTRPCVVLTADDYNRENWVVVVVPLTSHDTAERDQVLIEPPEGGLTVASVTLPDQIRAIDRDRLVRRLGRLEAMTMLEIAESLKVVLELP